MPRIFAGEISGKGHQSTNSHFLASSHYWFWGAIEKNVGQYQPESLPQLKMVVENLASGNDEAQVRRTAENTRKRISLCTANNGGHFEAQL